MVAAGGAFFFTGAFAGVTFLFGTFWASGREVFAGVAFWAMAFFVSGAEPFVAAFFEATVFAVPFWVPAELAAPFLAGAFAAAVFLLGVCGVAVLFMPVTCLVCWVCGLLEVFRAAVGVGPAPFPGATLVTLRLRSECRAMAGGGAFLGTGDEETAGVSAAGDGATGDEISGSAAGSGVCSAGEAGESLPFVIGASVRTAGMGEEASASLS